jgi:hypothetical protein
MKSRKNLGLALAIGAASLFFAACQQPTAPTASTASVAIDSVAWYLYNLPTDKGWTDSENNNPVHFVCNVDIYLSGSYSVSDILSAKISNKTTYWSISNISKGYNASGKYLHGQFVGDELASFPMGSFTAEVTLKNGKTASQSFIIGAPGGASTTASVVATEDITIANSYPALKRATIPSKSIDKSDNTAAISFIVNDSNVYSGYIYFYDAEGNGIGYSKRFRDIQTGKETNIVQDGLNTNGTTNLSIGLSDITSVTTNSTLSSDEFANISYCRVLLIDGAQYTQKTTSTWDYLSYSEKVTF